MNKREPIKTTRQQAADYWSRRVDECDLSVDWSEATTHCWRCGCERNLERCHIVPDSLGGKDKPSNIVLLCKRCHADGPNVTDPEIMWDWIKAYSVPFYDTFWTILALKEYRFIYNRSFTQDIADICSAAGFGLDDDTVSATIKEILGSVSEKVSTHFGQPYLNTATIAGMYRIALKEFAERHQIRLPSGTQDAEERPKKPWYLEE